MTFEERAAELLATFRPTTPAAVPNSDTEARQSLGLTLATAEAHGRRILRLDHAPREGDALVTWIDRRGVECRATLPGFLWLCWDKHVTLDAVVRAIEPLYLDESPH